MKSRQYYGSIADERMDREEKHLEEFHDSIFDIPGYIVTLWYILLSLVAPKQRKDITKYE